MPEPITSAGAGLVSAKLIPPLVAFCGALITLSYLPAQLTKRQWGAALGFAVFGAYFGTPSLVIYLRQLADWLPVDGSIEGLVGLVIGMSAIFVVAGFTVVGKRVAADPTTLIGGGK